MKMAVALHVIAWIEMPEKVIALDPVLVDKVEYYTVTFEEQPTAFNFEEVSNAPLKIEPTKALQIDVNDIAETVAFSLEDSISLGETVALLLEEVVALRTEIETLKGGK